MRRYIFKSFLHHDTYFINSYNFNTNDFSVFVIVNA